MIIYVQAMCFPDMAVRREIQSLNVMCSNKPSGCDFIGTAKEYYQVSNFHLYEAFMMTHWIRITSRVACTNQRIALTRRKGVWGRYLSQLMMFWFISTSLKNASSELFVASTVALAQRQCTIRSK